MIVERYKKERELPILDKVKFLVPQEFTVSNFCVVVRSKLVIRPSQSLHFIVGNKAGMFTQKTYWLNPRKNSLNLRFQSHQWIWQWLSYTIITKTKMDFFISLMLQQRCLANIKDSYEPLRTPTGPSSYWYCTFLLTNLKIYFTKLKISFFYRIICHKRSLKVNVKLKV